MFVSDKGMQYPGNESSTTLECSFSPEGVTPQIFGFGGGRRGLLLQHMVARQDSGL